MAEGPDEEMDRLVAEVRKTITDNRHFLDKLLDETEDDLKDEEESDDAVVEEEFEEL
jgi:hypothetical protein